MNIYSLQQKESLDSGMITAAARRAAHADKSPLPSAVCDRVQTSALARMIADQSPALRTLHKPRPEMVQKFREQNLSFDIPDSAIDAVFRKLASAWAS